MITKTHLKYAVIAIAVAAVFGITLGMEIECMIPVSFVAISCLAYEHMHNDITYLKAILNGAVPAISGGLIIWICFALKLWIG